MTGVKEAIETPNLDGVYFHPLAVSTEQAAQLIGLSPRTLVDYRGKGIGPKYIKSRPGRAGSVLYRVRDLQAWLDEQTVVGGGGR